MAQVECPGDTHNCPEVAERIGTPNVPILMPTTIPNAGDLLAILTPPVGPTPGQAAYVPASGLASPSDFWPGSTQAQGSVPSLAPAGVLSIVVPIPAGLLQFFGLAINVLAAEPTLAQVAVLQRYSLGCMRDALGAIIGPGFGSGNSMLSQPLAFGGGGVVQPAFSGGAYNANDVQIDFTNGHAAPLSVRYQWILTPAFAL